MRPPRLDDDEGAPEWWRRAKGLRIAPVILVVVLAAIVLHAAQQTPPPALRTSCTTPAIALSTSTVQQHRPVRWSATGPATMTFELTIGVVRFDADAHGTLRAVPDAGLAKGATQQGSVQQRMPQGCHTSGAFGAVVPPGSYTVRMFRFTGTPTTPAATPVATVHLTVTR